METTKKIVAVLRNYRAHAREMKSDVPVKPFFFLKPSTSLLWEGNSIVRPRGADLHHEVELGVLIGKKCRHLSTEEAMDHVKGWVLALDMTARNLQAEEKEKRIPWFHGKCYDTFCPVSSFISIEKLEFPFSDKTRLWLEVNGEKRQDGVLTNMIFDVPTLISEASQVVTLEENDLILTGTPSGIGSVLPGDIITAGLQQDDREVVKIQFPVTDEESV